MVAFWRLVVIAGCLSGCAATTALEEVAIGGTLYGARSPSTQIEQIYYLGSFDPQGQLKPEMYRIRVRGQASALSGVNFGSGWVPAQVVDSLSTQFTFNDQGQAQTTGTGNASFAPGRAQVLFGPEGFREAPRDHRLVIVMGSDPSAFFSAVDETLGVVAGAKADRVSTEVANDILRALAALRAEELAIDRVKRLIEEDDEAFEARSRPETPPQAPEPTAQNDTLTETAVASAAIYPGGAQ